MSDDLIEQLVNKIYVFRDQKVMFDSDLSLLHCVSTKRLNEQVKRNKDRFPEDFMFQLTKEEFEILRSQFATSSNWGGRRYPPYAFTEHGAIMLASVLNSETAVKMSVFVVRAFVELRKILLSNEALSKRIGEIEKKVQTQDSAIHSLNLAITQLLRSPPPSKRKVVKGFQ